MIKNILRLLLIILGWFIGGIGFTMEVRHPINTIVFLVGIGLILYGVVTLIASLNSKFNTKEK